jgi:hypothetical protein
MVAALAACSWAGQSGGEGGSQNKEIYGEQTQETTEKEMTKEAKSKKVAPKQGKERTVAGKRKMWPRNTGSAEWVTYQAYKKDGQIVYDGVLHEDTYEALKDEKGKPIPAKAVPIPVDP